LLADRFLFFHRQIVESMSSRPLVLVTGAARRVGRAIALELAAHGCDLAVHHRGSAADAAETVAQARALGASAELFAADLAVEADCRALVPAVLVRCGRLAAIVNNASTFEDDNVQTFSYAAMERHARANTGPAVLLAQALHAHAEGANTTGCVVNLLDQKLWNLNPDHFSYTLSKAALQAATVMLAQALAPRLRVCGVAPGVTLPSGPMTDAEFAAAQRLTPLQRSSTPDDIARAVRFLIESPAITGSTLMVDGGQHLVAQPRDVLHLVRGDRN
jgi:NAD(P)-dependent dehydrogenase (short-subunit alcohol dehydrogenase family)